MQKEKKILEKDEYILEMDGICKSFPGVKALDNVSLKVKKGTVHAVMGENGAGKSTLMKVLLGVYKRDAGTVKFKGEVRNFSGPHDALNCGLAMIHQELSCVRQLTVAQNIFLGKERTMGFLPILKSSEMAKEASRLLQQLEISVNPNEKIGDLSVSRQQMCEIAKATSYNADLIIMDEPTSAITESEVEHLFKIIRSLTEKGITIIYITHKMDEVFAITDEVSVYRDGQYVTTVTTKDTDRNKLIELMVGREVTNMFPKEYAQIGEVKLKVSNLSRKGEFENVSFEVRKGEILGVAGLMGAGRSEVMETLFGVRHRQSGEVFIDGKKVEIKTPADAIKNKIALLTEDRKFNGCFLPLSVRCNTYMASIDKHSKGIFIDYKKTVKTAQEMKDALSTKTPNLEQKIVNLSGGNQQKVLIARWLLTEPDILIIDEPTRGIDVGAKSEIHKLITKLAQSGKAIIMISSELPEVLGMSDRVMVMSEGKVIGFLDANEATQERVLLYATGQTS